MRVGDLVEYKEASGRLGVIITTQGKQWVKVLWPEKIILLEHIKDLIVKESGK